MLHSVCHMVICISLFSVNIAKYMRLGTLLRKDVYLPYNFGGSKSKPGILLVVSPTSWWVDSTNQGFH
jgi:hypothetical protein